MDEQRNENMPEIAQETVPEAVQDVAPETKPEGAPTPRSRRRPKSKAEIFKESTLPLIILAVAALLIVVFIIGSITRAVQKKHIDRDASIAVSESVSIEEARLNAEAEEILADAERLAAGYAFEEAIARINSFSGNIGGYPELQDAMSRYEYGKQSLVLWEDPTNIINLSFHMLVADPERAYNHPDWGSAMLRNYITTNEFRNILQRLYENDYILVSLDDFVTASTNEAGMVTYAYKELYLPKGKKPLMLTQTNVNYNTYLVDSDGDLVADRNGVGIASRLVVGPNGNVTCEMVQSDGTTVTGPYDLIPILDEFVAKNPDFSYGGAKAVIALTGYNGLFGYRTDTEGRSYFGEETYEKNVAAVKAVAEALRNSGYDLGYYTYANSAYGRFNLSMIQAEMNSWNSEVVPILGNLDIMVFAQESDISSSVMLGDEKYNYLKSCGFNYFLGFGVDGSSYTFIADEYVRQARLMVTGNYLTYNSSYFNNIFDTEDVLEYDR